MREIRVRYLLVIAVLLAVLLLVSAAVIAQEPQDETPTPEEEAQLEAKELETSQVEQSGPTMPQIEAAQGVRSPDEAIRLIDPELREEARAGGPELLKITVLVKPGTDLSRYFERQIVISSGEFDRIVGLVPATDLIKLATVPGTLAVLTMEARTPPEPPDPFALLGETEPPEKQIRSLEEATPQALPREGRMFQPKVDTTVEGAGLESFYTNDTNGVWQTWSLGVTGDGAGDAIDADHLKLAVVDTGIDFANPDLFGTQARVMDSASPYFVPALNMGWPIAFDDRSMSDYALNIQDYRGNWGWYMNAMVSIQDPDLGSTTPFTFSVPHPDLGVTVVYTVGGAIQAANTNGGAYRFGWHPDDSLADALGESAGVLVSGELGGAWGSFDTIYVDMLADYRFNATPADGWATVGQEIACVNLGWSTAGSCDLSAGMIYFVSNGVTPVPASDWLYGLPPVAEEGAVVAFMLNDATENGGDHGTLCAGTAIGQGNITKMPYAGSYGSLYWPPAWYNPAPWPAGDGGISQGPARDTWLIAMGNFYAGGSSLNNYDFAALGYDGLPAGDPLDRNDQPHIYTNSYGSGSVENDGWNLASRYVALINRGYVAQQSLTLPGDGDSSPLFVGSTGNSGFGYGTVTSPQPETAVMAGVGTVFGQFNLGDTALFRDWVNWGHLGGFSDRGPTSMSTLGVHTLANGFFGSGNVPLNYLYGGDWSVDSWAGSSRSGPEAGGILALIYDAFWQTHGRYPTWYEARTLLMNGNRTAYNDPLAGPGLANALNSVEIALGTRGVQVSSSEGDGFWIPGTYRGTEYAGFARGLFTNDSDTETFTVTNYGPASVSANLEPVTLELYESRDWNFASRSLATEGPGSRYYGRRLYGPPGSNPGYGAADPFFDATDPTDQALLANADLLVVRLSWPQEQFREDGTDNWWFVYAAAWRDTDVADGTWFTDANANGVMNAGEFQDEWVRINYDYHGNTAEVRIREPMKLINGLVGPNEPPMAAMDDILIMPRHLYYGGYDTTDLKITVELYEEVEWGELSFDSTTLNVPAGGATTFDVTAETYLVESTILSEDFEGAFPPAGWQVFTNTVGGAWDRNDALGQINRVTGYGSGFAAAAGSDGNSGTAWDTELWSPAVDLTSVSGAGLRFASNFQDYAGNGDAYLDVSTDAGANWTNLDSWTSDDPGGTGGGGVLRSHDLSTYTGQTILLRWRFVASSSLDWFWQIDNVLVQDAQLEPPGEYAGYIKLTYTDPYTYSEYIPVEKQIWFPSDIDPTLGGVDQPYLYDNGVMFGARGPSSIGEGAESGDWRFFYTDVDGVPPAGTYLLAHTYWQSKGTPPWATDIDTLFYGPVANDPLFAGMDPILGPHSLEVMGGSLRAGSAPDWEYHTSSGGPSDWTAIPMVDEGLHGVAAQVVRWGGESTRVPYTITVGTVQATPEVVLEGLTCPSCTVPLTFKTNHEDLAGAALEAAGYGFNQPVHKTLSVTQGQSTYADYTITADDAYKLQINTSHSDPAVDVDLAVYLDGQLVGSSGRSDSNEQVILSFPAAGEYQIELYGYGIPMGVTQTDLDIVEISGAGAMTVSNLPISITLGTEYDLDLHFETQPEPGIWTGVVFLGPQGSPTAVEIPVTLYQGDAAKTASAEAVLPGELVTFTITVDENPGNTVIWEVNDIIPPGFEFVAVEGASYMSATDSIYWSNTVHPWREATTALPLDSGSSDDGYGALALPFDFPFFTETVTTTSELKVSTNGYATFGPDGTDFSNDAIPNATDPNAFLAPFWDDQEIDGGDASQGMWYDVHGEPGSQVLAVEWRIQDLGTTSQPNEFQAQLYENGDLWFLYGDMNEGRDGWGNNATIGLENRAEDNGTQFSHNTPSIQDYYAIHFTPNVSGTYDIAYAGTLLQVFGQHTITLTLRANAEGLQTNTAYVNTGSNSCPISATLAVTEPALYLTKTVEPVHQYPGELVTYTIAFGNEGIIDAMDVVVSDTLPAGVDFESTSMGTYSASAHEVVWSGDLTASDAQEATIVVRIDASTVPTTWITNTAYLFYADNVPLMDSATHHAQALPNTYYYLPVIYKNSPSP